MTQLLVNNLCRMSGPISRSGRGGLSRRCFPPRVDRDDAVSWLASRLDDIQQEGVCRVVFHSMVLQYLGEKDRRALGALIRKAGARANIQQPLAHITFEWTPMRDDVQLRLTCWPGGQTRLLATCHAYGDWIDWR